MSFLEKLSVHITENKMKNVYLMYFMSFLLKDTKISLPILVSIPYYEEIVIGDEYETSLNFIESKNNPQKFIHEIIH